MRNKVFLALVIIGTLNAMGVCAQGAGSPLQSSNLLNPNVSVIGWFQSEAGHRVLGAGAQAPAPFQLKEAELAFQSVVDPYARADFFAGIGPEGIELEEGYLTWFNLPGDFALKAGKFRHNLGKFNRTHTPETSFADRPLVHEKFFGEEGLSGEGGSLSWHLPNPWLLVNLDGEVATAPDPLEVPALGQGESKDLLYVGRMSAYGDLTESANVTFGASHANGPAGFEFDTVSGSSHTLKVDFHGLDLTFRWKNPRRAIYRSLFWQTEIFWSRRSMADIEPVESVGLFTHLEYQLARRWRVGARWDWTELPQNSDERVQGSLGYVTFTPSEFSLVSLQGKEVRREDGEKESLGFLKVTFNIGAHGAHPF